MLNDRTMIRGVALLVLAVLPSLASSQAAQSSTPKPPDWQAKAVTQITVYGSPQQLKAFQEGLPPSITKGFEAQAIVASPMGKKKLVYSYLTDTEMALGESILSGFYSALKASTEKMPAGEKPPVMRTSIYRNFTCRIATCGGQQGLVGRPKPPCTC